MFEKVPLSLILDRKEAFGVISGQFLKIQENPNDRYFIYEYGWKMFLEKESVDIIMLILILFIITPIYCFEDETGMSRIIICKKIILSTHS